MAFSDQKVLFLSEQKITDEIFILRRILYVTAILTNALLGENSTNSLKAEARTNRYLLLPSTHSKFESH